MISNTHAHTHTHTHTTHTHTHTHTHIHTHTHRDVSANPENSCPFNCYFKAHCPFRSITTSENLAYVYQHLLKVQVTRGLRLWQVWNDCVYYYCFIYAQQTDTQKHRQAGKQTNKQTDRQMDGKVGRSDSRTPRRTNIHQHTDPYISGHF